MIEWLSSWLKQVILLVLIATFIDLLLPNSAMDRYVKLVMGLLIIMAILSPTVQLLHKDLDLASIALSDQPREKEKSLDSLDQIKQKSGDLKKTQEALVQQQVSRSIEETVKKDVDHQFLVEVMETKVQTESTAEAVPQIKSMQVTARIRFSENPKMDEEQVMRPIEPVVISGDSIQRQNAQVVSNTKRLELTRRITQYLQQTWHLLPEQINVRVDPA